MRNYFDSCQIYNKKNIRVSTLTDNYPQLIRHP